jgi:hypothetical protein
MWMQLVHESVKNESGQLCASEALIVAWDEVLYPPKWQEV